MHGTYPEVFEASEWLVGLAGEPCTRLSGPGSVIERVKGWL